jgi:galactose-1-phosphate uridylyltransferase
MGRLARLEERLLSDSVDFLPHTEPEGHGFVSIFKNYGRLVGGSLAHGHQQITFSNVMPRRVQDNRLFQVREGETFSNFLVRENPAGLTIVEYGPATLVVPYFMRRPYDMVLLVKDTGKQHLYELTETEVTAVAAGWRDASCAIHRLMPAIGREVAYNVLTHNGPGTGLYFEFLPFTQEEGGLEKLGLYVCQQDPYTAAAHVRELLGET